MLDLWESGKKDDVRHRVNFIGTFYLRKVRLGYGAVGTVRL